jgi:hypothetical protein
MGSFLVFLHTVDPLSIGLEGFLVGENFSTAFAWHYMPHDGDGSEI